MARRGNRLTCKAFSVESLAVGLAHGLGLTIAAKGIEDSSQQSYLEKMFRTLRQA